MRYTGHHFDGGMNSFDNSQAPSFDKLSSHSSNHSNSQASPKEGMLKPKNSRGAKARKVTTSSSGSKKSRNSNTSQTESQGSNQPTRQGPNQQKRAIDAVEDLESLYAELRGNVALMAKQQYGSKQLQRYLEKAPPELVDFIIEEVIDELHNLMSD